MELLTFNNLVIAWILVAVIIFPILLRVTQPYGRHTSGGWGPMISNQLGWIIMESPSLLIITALFFAGDQPKDIGKWIFFSLWFIHYFNRSFIFPLRTRTRKKKMPVVIMFSAVFFNLVNGTINGYWLGFTETDYGTHWLTDPRFIVGIIVFIAGFIINQDSDTRLINLRKNSNSNKSESTGYVIPFGGMFKYVSCPNFLGEIMEWVGYAVMCWSLPALSFAVWTVVNLIPRALDHHRWYKKNFSDYPSERKAVIPFVI